MEICSKLNPDHFPSLKQAVKLSSRRAEFSASFVAELAEDVVKQLQTID